MSGDTVISDNTANNGCGGGVFVGSGNFNMSGDAVISDNKAPQGNGGGVEVDTGMFNMGGGTISVNTAPYGGGVSVDGGGNFTMSGGNISSGNIATYGGGGVYVGSGNFTMSGDAVISGNRAFQGNGGGVYVNNDGTFILMNGSNAVISGNTAFQGNGGGVYVNNDGTFIMSGGTISDNTAVNGGGVYVYDRGTLAMSGSNAVISGNTALQHINSSQGNGGGVYVNNYGIFTIVMGGGTIYGYDGNPDNRENNTVKDGNPLNNRGHAVYVSSNPENRRENTVSSQEVLHYDGSNGFTVGNWDKAPNLSIVITIADIDEPELLAETTVRVNVNETKVFEVKGFGQDAIYQWYLNGSPAGQKSSYNFVKSTAGIYEVSVVVTDAGAKSSGSCQVIVR